MPHRDDDNGDLGVDYFIENAVRTHANPASFLSASYEPVDSATLDFIVNPGSEESFSPAVP